MINLRFIFFILVSFILLPKVLLANDLCEDAETLACGQVIMSTTEDATTTGNPAICNTLVSAAGKWYKFEGTGGAIEVNTCSSAYDTKLHVFEGSCEDLICVAGNDDACGLQSRVNFNSMSATDYFILVNGNGGAVGDFMLTLTCVINGCMDENACNYNPLATVDDGTCNDPDCESVCDGMDTGPTIAGMPCDDGNPLTVNAIYDEDCNCQPAGIDCTHPLIISTLPFNVSGNTADFGDDYESNDCGSLYLGGDDFVMEFTPTASEDFNLVASNLGERSGLLVFDACPDDESAVCIGSSVSAFDYEEITALNLSADVTYYIVISTWPDPQSTSFDFSLSSNIVYGCNDPNACNYNEFAEEDDGSCFNCMAACPGDSCDDNDPLTEITIYDDSCNCVEPLLGIDCTFPVAIDEMPFSFTGNITDYGNNFLENPCGPYFLGGDDFVMKFTPAATEDFNLYTDNSYGDFWLSVFDSCPSEASARCISNTSNSTEALDLVAGTTYYIVISSFVYSDASDINFMMERNITLGCTDPAACNYFEAAEEDDGTCFSCGLSCPGDSCDDNDPNTPVTFYNKSCDCVEPSKGSSCSFPFLIEELPFSRVDSASNLITDYKTNPCGTKFLEGEDFVFSFTPEISDEYMILAKDLKGNTWLSIYEGCPGEADAICIGKPSFSNSIFELDAGTTYFIIFSSVANTSSPIFSLSVKRNVIYGCKDPSACNYNEAAVEDYNCINCGSNCPGDSCDDGNPYTPNTIFDFECNCIPDIKLIDNKGTDFWIMFNSNALFETTEQLEPSAFVILTSTSGSYGQVEIPGLNFQQFFNINPNEVIAVELPEEVEMITSDEIENKAVHITASNEVVVYGLNQKRATTDAFTAIPVDALGNEYVISSYEGGFIESVNSSFGIVAPEANTNVSITLPVSTNDFEAGVPFLINLDKGEAYQLLSSGLNDITGTIIKSDKPVAVFGGHNCTYIPNDIPACDHLVEQFAPVDSWGKQFYTASLATRTDGDFFRMTAAFDNTSIEINGATVATINKGEFHEELLPSDSYNIINTSQPIQLTQYSLGSAYDGVLSDPFMIMIPPYEQFSGSTSFATPATNIPVNYANIVTPEGGVGKITLDEIPIPTELYEQIGDSDFFGVRMPVSVGVHTLNGGNIPFGAFIYGFGFYDSYGYPAGAIFSPVESVASIALKPEIEIISVNEMHCVNASLFDQFGVPVVGVRVDFQVSGANNETGFVFTNENGMATYCYTGSSTGEDNISATVGDLTGMVTANWTDVAGCTTEIACNYNPAATLDDDSCNLPDCEGNCAGDASGAATIGSPCDDGDASTVNEQYDNNCNCSSDIIAGCTDTAACNYNANATVDDNTCTINDCNGSCGGPATIGTSCDDGDNTTQNDKFTLECECMGEQILLPGCTDVTACNYNPNATIDDGSCMQSGCVMPITLILFDGSALSDGNLLKWITASEINNDYFTLQASFNNSNFMDIATISGSGTISTSSNYSYLHRTSNSGITYYRLLQTDFDGTTTKSNTIAIQRGEPVLQIVGLYPIPSSTFINVQFTAPAASQIAIEIFSVTGSILYKQKIMASSSTSQLKIDVKDFPAGVYFISIASNKQNQIQKFVVE